MVLKSVGKLKTYMMFTTKTKAYLKSSYNK